MPIVAFDFFDSERCIGVGTETLNVFVLISYRLLFSAAAIPTILLGLLSHAFAFSCCFIFFLSESTSMARKKIKNKRRMEITFSTMPKMAATTMIVTLMIFKQATDIFAKALSIVEGYKEEFPSYGCSYMTEKLYHRICTVLEGLAKIRTTTRTAWLLEQVRVLNL